MKRSVGARALSASSTKRTMRAMVLSAVGLVTRTRSKDSVLIDPAKTSAPGSLRRGTLSPVTGLSSTPEVPLTTSPSQGTRSPGRTCTICPTLSASAATSRVLLPTSSRAVFGTSLVSARMLLRAFPAETPSSNSPTAKRKTTNAASSGSPITSAPLAAMVMSISMVKGMPTRAMAKARRATGISPINVAMTKAQWETSAGRASRDAHAIASKAPLPRTKRPFVV